jgi:hypothetical protein
VLMHGEHRALRWQTAEGAVAAPHSSAGPRSDGRRRCGEAMRKLHDGTGRQQRLSMAMLGCDSFRPFAE